MKRILYISAIFLFMTGCTSDDNPNQKDVESNNEPLKIEISAIEKESIKTSNEFACDIWDVLSKDHNENFIFSPFSFQIALSMAANGGDINAQEKITNLLSPLKENADISLLNNLSEILLHTLPKVDNAVNIAIANSIWCNEIYDYNNSYELIVKDIFNASFHKYIPFTKDAMNSINQWCENSTYGKIENLYTTPPSEDAIIINTTYFDGKWKSPFNPNENKFVEFTSASGITKNVKMMRSSEELTARANDEMTNVSIPYGNASDDSGFCMNLYIPTEGNDLEALMSKYISDKSDIEWTRNHQAWLTLPIFEIFSHFDVSNALNNLGLSDILEQNLPYILQDAPFNISNIRQMTKIEVNEEGSTAAAATVISSVIGIPLDVTVNRPFFFTIRENSTGVILFIGKVVEL